MSDIQHDWIKEQVGDLQNKSPDNKDSWISNALKGKKSIVNAQDVFVIQSALKSLWHDPWKVDGVYKEKWKNISKTIDAVKDFQNKNWLTVDWQVWPETIAKLLEKLGTPAVPVDAARPAVPVDAARPAVPVDAARPAVPVDAARPAVPVDAARPAVPVDAARPAVPVDAARPAVPVDAAPSTVGRSDR